VNDKIKWITRSAVGIALIIVIQLVTKSLGQQLITGSLVNLILALMALLFGWSVGAAAAVVSPFVAYLLGINAQIAVVPAIAVGNLVYVLVIALLVKLLKGKSFSANEKLSVFIRNLIAVIAAAVCKFAIQYLLIVKWIAPAFLPAKAQAVMAVNFGVMQLFTACIGGVLACMIYLPVSKGVGSGK
jgi:hypothetical protein